MLAHPAREIIPQQEERKMASRAKHAARSKYSHNREKRIGFFNMKAILSEGRKNESGIYGIRLNQLRSSRRKESKEDRS